MSLPRRIKSRTATYKVKAVDLKGEDSGYTDTRHHEIGIEKKQAKANKQVTLVHEILHVCFDGTGIQWDHLTEEQVCATIAPLLTEIVQRNSKLIAYLQEQP